MLKNKLERSLSPSRGHDIPQNDQPVVFDRSFTLCAFRKVSSHVWSVPPTDSAARVVKGGARLNIGPLASLEVIAVPARIVRTCDCCVVLGDTQLCTEAGGLSPRSPNMVSGRTNRDRCVMWLRKNGAVFDCRELFNKSQYHGECMQSVFFEDWEDDRSNKGTPVALVKRQDPRKLWNELRTLIACRGNPHIVDLVGAFQCSDGAVAVATLFAYNGDLYKALTTRTFSLNEALNITKQILSGTAYLHENGLVARDIKAENILVLDEACRHVSLTDLHFSIAKDDPEFQRERCGTLGKSS